MKCLQSKNKQKVNIGTIGHIDHGKTSLTRAISQTHRGDDGSVVFPKPSFQDDLIARKIASSDVKEENITLCTRGKTSTVAFGDNSWKDTAQMVVSTARQRRKK